MLAKIYLNDVCYANTAAVPFMLLVTRFLSEGDESMREFVVKFLSISISMLLSLDKPKEKKAGRGRKASGATSIAKQRAEEEKETAAECKRLM